MNYRKRAHKVICRIVTSFVDSSALEERDLVSLVARCGNVGINLTIRRGVIILYPERLSLGDSVGISENVWMNAAGGITIGDGVLIGPNTVVHSANHRFEDSAIPIRQQGHDLNHTVIEDDVWIAAAVVVTPGARIGRGSVIGAGAVVVGDIPPYSVAMGVPARAKRERGQREA